MSYSSSYTPRMYEKMRRKVYFLKEKCCFSNALLETICVKIDGSIMYFTKIKFVCWWCAEVTFKGWELPFFHSPRWHPYGMALFFFTNCILWHINDIKIIREMFFFNLRVYLFFLTFCCFMECVRRMIEYTLCSNRFFSRCPLLDPWHAQIAIDPIWHTK